MVDKKEEWELDMQDWSTFIDYDAAKKLSDMYLDREKKKGKIGLDLYKDRALFENSLKEDNNEIDYEYESKLRGVDTEAKKDLSNFQFNLAEKTKNRDRASATNLYNKGNPFGR